MAVIALTSAKGSPGVTTTALAMALAWSRPVLLVEADPAGGDIMAGYVRAQLPSDRGIAHLAISARHDRLAEEFNSQLIDIAQPKSTVSRVLLAGVSDPAQAATVAPVWDRLSTHFGLLGHADTGTDVIIDCGRLTSNYPPLPLLAGADFVLLVVRSTLRSVSGAKPAMDLMRQGLGTRADRIGLIVIEGGEYPAPDIAKALRTPAVATMPWRANEAAALSDGVGSLPNSSTLLRAARTVQAKAADRVTAMAALAAAQPSVIAAPDTRVASMPSSVYGQRVSADVMAGGSAR